MFITTRRARVHSGIVLAAALFTLSLGARAQTADPAVIAKIRDEGMNRSQYMPTITYLTDVIGARLTLSNNLKRANNWTMAKLTEWGMSSGHLEAWGPFGRGWELEKYSAQVVSPTVFPLVSYPEAWSPGLKKPVKAEVVYLDAKTPADLEKYKGMLKDKIVLGSPMMDVKAHFEAEAARVSDADLANMAQATPVPPGGGGRPRTNAGAPPPGSGLSRAAIARFAMAEGAAALLRPGRGDGGNIFVQQATVFPAPAAAPDANAQIPPRRISPWAKDSDKMMLPQVAVAAEQYNRLARMAMAGEKPTVQMEFAARYTDLDNGMAFNTVAEIPGTDKKDEIVMCGGHMDSWQGGTGATDNAAGVVACMEALRILKVVGVQPRRTIRIALWTGEEQGLFGSQAYTKAHFGTMSAKTPENDKVSAYFNLDNGTGKIRGVYCQGNEAVMPIFAEWLKPFADLGASTVTIRNTGGTDHLSFDGVGIPGFQFIQDSIEYGTRTHHSTGDVVDRIQEADMKQASVIIATFLYQTAMRDEKLPRKPAAPVTTSVKPAEATPSVHAQ